MSNKNLRPCTTIRLPYDHVMVLYDYITGFEWEEIIGIYRDGKAKNEDDNALRIRADKRLYELLVIEVDGNVDNTYDAVRELPKPAYEYAIQQINETLEGKKKLETFLHPTQPAAS